MPQKILIVEDNKAHMEALSKIVKELPKDVQLYCAYNEGDAYKIALEHHIHLFIIDIVLHTHKPGDVSGLCFAKEVREISKYKFTPLIFVTSLEDPQLYSYSQLHCFGYIEKPFSVSQVRGTILSALEFPLIEDADRYVYFQKDRIVYSIRLGDIVYIENSRRKIKIYCKKDELEIPYKTCEEILQELDSELFIRCSRYCIVNRKHIEQVDYTNRFIKLKYREKPIEIGVVLKKTFKQRLNNE